MNLAFIESPLQAINVIECLNTPNVKNKQCRFVMFSNTAISDANLEPYEYVFAREYGEN